MTPITVHQLAAFLRGSDPPEWTGQDYADLGLPFMGGCEICHVSIAAYNAHPSKSGFLRCGDCIGDLGWDDPAEATAAAAHRIAGREVMRRPAKAKGRP
jgi:hypothetical protein